MEKLDKILDSYCAKGSRTTKDELLGGAFVVVSKDGALSRIQPPPLPNPPPTKPTHAQDNRPR